MFEEGALLLDLVGVLLDDRPVVLDGFRPLAFGRGGRLVVGRWLLVGGARRGVVTRLVPAHILLGSRPLPPHARFGAFPNSLRPLSWFRGRSSLIGDRIVVIALVVALT